jgi:hypothetical protein
MVEETPSSPTTIFCRGCCLLKHFLAGASGGSRRRLPQMAARYVSFGSAFSNEAGTFSGAREAQSQDRQFPVSIFTTTYSKNHGTFK